MSADTQPDIKIGTDTELVRPADEPVLLSVEHETRYDYTSPVEQAHHLAHLRPFDDGAQKVELFDCLIKPTPAHQTTERDVFGNHRTSFSITSPHECLRVVVRSRIRQLPRPVEAGPGVPWEAVRQHLGYRVGEPFEPASEFAFASPYIPLHAELRDYALESFTPGRGIAEASVELMQRIHRDFEYEPAATEVSTPALDAFVQRQGVCQDFAHVMIGCLRSIGLAARYISGYLLTHPAPGQPRLIGADASHAWVGVYCPAVDPGFLPVAGPWLELDPTNDCLAQTDHVRLAIGRDYGDVTPLRGVIRGGGRHTILVRVTTAPVEAAGEAPQPAVPAELE